MENKTPEQILSMVDANSRNDLINRLMSRSEKLLELAVAMYAAPYTQIGKANVREAIEDAQSAFDTLNEYDAASQRADSQRSYAGGYVAGTTDDADGGLVPVAR